MRNNWNVTFEIVTQESAEHGDAEERGFEAEGVSFREAIQCFGDYAEQAGSWPIDGSVRWFDGPTIEDRAHFERGEDRRLSLHIPEQITPSSRIRLARYLKLKV